MGKSKDKESKKGKVQMVTKSVRKSHARKAKKGGVLKVKDVVNKQRGEVIEADEALKAESIVGLGEEEGGEVEVEDDGRASGIDMAAKHEAILDEINDLIAEHTKSFDEDEMKAFRRLYAIDVLCSLIPPGAENLALLFKTLATVIERLDAAALRPN